MKIAYTNRLVFLIISAAVFISMLIISPRRHGDGVEYFMMTEALFNHLSPDLQDMDLQTMEKLRAKFPIFHYPGEIGGYCQANDNRIYFRHFWVYPLFNLPVKFILHIFHCNELKVFQVTNSILLILALFHIVFISKLTELQKMLFALLAVFCPAFWFIRWTHPEIFSYSFVTISLVYMHRKNFPVSIVSAAIASTQNQPLIFFVLFLWMKGMIRSKKKWKNFFIFSLSAIPAAAPNIFSYVKYETVNKLFIEIASFSNISIFRVCEMFFDLNIGMLPYIPVILFVFFGIVVRDGSLKRKISLPLQLFLLILVMMALCAATFNWNSGTSGPTRHVIWMLPLIFYIMVVEGPIQRSIYLSALWIAIIIQGSIVFCGGGFTPDENHIYHTPLARFVLNRFPAIYNPSKEIFIERTLHGEDLPLSPPVVYYYNGRCKKALVKGENGELMYINY